MTVVLYRPSFDARSGTGQLLTMQWRGLNAAGVPTLLACERGALKFWLRTGVRARRRSAAAIERLQAQGAVVVDHGLSIPSAELVFVHNVVAEAARHLREPVAAALVERERQFFRALSRSAVVVANSKLAADALREHFGLARERVAVLHPGFDSLRYSPQRAQQLRAAARRTLGVDDGAPLVGFVTSGDFAKRGLDLFLDCAARIAAARPDARFLVVGSKRLPDEAGAHALVRSGLVRYRPKIARPEPWFAALDLFLYPARFEEFGMVLAEAQAMAVPVLTSRRVGAAECLPAAYAPWLIDEPHPNDMAERAVALLADADLRAQLAGAAAATVTAFDERAYVEGTRRLLPAQNLRLK
ncbi:MAG TPA: glycosyltransferase family 4 protein [Rhodanobacteraceae bacterium]|nr:glycosyltransferase family 4 protein [Rhodanobacteraceae bacterium]